MAIYSMLVKLDKCEGKRRDMMEVGQVGGIV